MILITVSILSFLIGLHGILIIINFLVFLKKNYFELYKSVINKDVYSFYGVNTSLLFRMLGEYLESSADPILTERIFKALFWYKPASIAMVVFIFAIIGMVYFQ